MGVWEVTVYDRNWKIINQDYKECSDGQQAELKAEADCDWLGGAHWKVRKIR